MCDLESAEHVFGSSRPLGPGIVLQGAQGGGRLRATESSGGRCGGPAGGSKFPSSGAHFPITNNIYTVMPE